MQKKNSAENAIHFIDIHGPDLVLCDINLNGEIDGIAVAEHINKTTNTPLIFITALSDRSTLDRAKKTLPYGYIVKPFNNRDLLTAIELAMYKHSVEIEKYSLSIDRMNSISSDPFSDREYEILRDIICGFNNLKISETRNISVSTVKYHITNILNKLNVKNRSGALHKVIELLT